MTVAGVNLALSFLKFTGNTKSSLVTAVRARDKEVHRKLQKLNPNKVAPSVALS